MHQPGIGDLSAFESEFLKVLQTFEVYQPRVGDLSVFELQKRWRFHYCQVVLQPEIGFPLVGNG